MSNYKLYCFITFNPEREKEGKSKKEARGIMLLGNIQPEARKEK